MPKHMLTAYDGWLLVIKKKVFSTLNSKRKYSLKHVDLNGVFFFFLLPPLFKASKIRSHLPKVLVTEPPPKSSQAVAVKRTVWECCSLLRQIFIRVFTHTGTPQQPLQNALGADRYCKTLWGSTVGVAQSPPPRHLPSESLVDVRFTEVMEHTWWDRSLK